MLKFQAVCVDAHHPLTLAGFWREVLDWRITWETDDEVVLEPPAGSPAEGVSPDLVFVSVSDEKLSKNRLHLDLRPDDQDAEVERLEALGAQRVSVGQGEDVTWVVMADPEGNEFCVLRALRPDEIVMSVSA